VAAGYGGPADTWGRAWTPAEINDATFGVKVVIQWTGGFGSGSGFVDYVEVAVYYTPAAAVGPPQTAWVFATPVHPAQIQE
jgi:hypothetical protein